ncbi:MAG: hypothetical protein NC911_10500 [Candidatus Omnitrophica bacterium]|nr:hypothetical protein [Candidatus Omnitrophota bacterium]
MGKFERMRHLYHRRMKRARQQLKLLEEGKIKPAQLNSLAKRLLYKRFKAGHALKIKAMTSGAKEVSPDSSHPSHS